MPPTSVFLVYRNDCPVHNIRTHNDRHPLGFVISFLHQTWPIGNLMLSGKHIGNRNQMR